MITASDLRLGNWVWNEVQNIPVKVDMRILQDQVYADKGFKGGWKPIPLTEEILLKCGFRDVSSYKDYYLTVEDDLTIEISLRRNGITFTCISDVGLLCDVKYVHQLQNLYFAIAGKELEINL